MCAVWREGLDQARFMHDKFDVRVRFLFKLYLSFWC